MKRAVAVLSALVSIGLSISQAGVQQYKYQTPTPPGVAIPDTVETRFGTLHLSDGIRARPSFYEAALGNNQVEVRLAHVQTIIDDSGS